MVIRGRRSGSTRAVLVLVHQVERYASNTPEATRNARGAGIALNKIRTSDFASGRRFFPVETVGMRENIPSGLARRVGTAIAPPKHRRRCAEGEH